LIIFGLSLSHKIIAIINATKIRVHAHALIIVGNDFLWAKLNCTKEIISVS